MPETSQATPGAPGTTAVARRYAGQRLPARKTSLPRPACNLSRALEDGGTVTSVLVPWNTCGVFAASMLGVTAFEYAPYAIFNYAVPLIAILLAFLGIGVQYMTPEEVAEVEREDGMEAPDGIPSPAPAAPVAATAQAATTSATASRIVEHSPPESARPWHRIRGSSNNGF